MDISQLLSKQMLGPPELSGLQRSFELNKGSERNEQLKAAAKNFEGIFVNQILKQMQETVENASFDPDDGSSQQVYGMYSTFLNDMIAEQGGFGLWEKIYEQMVQMEGVQGQPKGPIHPGSLDEKG